MKKSPGYHIRQSLPCTTTCKHEVTEDTPTLYQRKTGKYGYRKKIRRRKHFLLLAAGILCLFLYFYIEPEHLISLGFQPEFLARFGIRTDLPDNISYTPSYSEDEPSVPLVLAEPEKIPLDPPAEILLLNGNRPAFTDYDIDHLYGEHYRELDRLGRCGMAYARLDRSMMPEGERLEIGMIRPSGWHTAKYPDLIDDLFLYNRCHLIAWCLTGQNANPLNLITGTRYLNKTGMLPYETLVADYLDHSDHHVLYRVTPYFHGSELVARGVEMEALSIEDNGRGVSFHVFLYNIQPGVRINYATGESQNSSLARETWRGIQVSIS